MGGKGEIKSHIEMRKQTLVERKFKIVFPMINFRYPLDIRLEIPSNQVWDVDLVAARILMALKAMELKRLPRKRIEGKGREKGRTEIGRTLTCSGR